MMFIQKPYKVSIHEVDNRYIGLSKNIGTPVHGEYLKVTVSDDTKQDVYIIIR